MAQTFGQLLDAYREQRIQRDDAAALLSYLLAAESIGNHGEVLMLLRGMHRQLASAADGAAVEMQAPVVESPTEV